MLALTTYWDDPVLQPQPSQEDFAPYPYPYPEPATRLFEIDVSQAAAPKLLNTLTVAHTCRPASATEWRAS